MNTALKKTRTFPTFVLPSHKRGCFPGEFENKETPKGFDVIIDRVTRLISFVEVSPERFLASSWEDSVGAYHITPDGLPAYEERYENVFEFCKVGDNKFLAVAKENYEMFHITTEGKPAYKERYARVHDFKLRFGQYMAEVEPGYKWDDYQRKRVESRPFYINPDGSPASR